MGCCCSCRKASDASTEAIKGVENSAFEKENDGSGHGSKGPKPQPTGKNIPDNSIEMSPIEMEKDYIDGVENEGFEKEIHTSEPVFKNDQPITKDSPISLKADRKKSKDSSKDEKYDAVPQKKSRNELQMGKVSLI